jgi:uncharacterized protein
MNADWSSRVFVGNSSINGLGLFTRRAFRTGDLVVLRHDRPITDEQPLDPDAGEEARHCVRTAGGRLLYKGFPGRFINHSCDPNCFVRYRGETAEIIALRPLERHEEATVHYAIDRWDEPPMACACGSERCLGVVPAGFFDLPLDRQMELSPFLSEWFVSEHAAAYRAFLERAGLDEIQFN